MRRLGLLLPLLAATALAAAGPRIASCTVRLDASPNGSGAVLATVRLAEAGPGPCLIPVGFSALTALRLCMGLIPAVLVVLALVVMRRWPSQPPSALPAA